MRGRYGVPAAAVALALTVVGSAAATHLGGDDIEGHTTLEQVLAGVDADGNPSTSYETLAADQVSEDYLVRDGRSERDDRLPTARAGREERRKSLAYFAQTTDFQFADEESPARVEFLDQPFEQEGPASAWRPQEAFVPFETEATIEQINRFAPASPVPQGDGTGNRMDLALITGDQADNSQLNETVWVAKILEGVGPLNFNSGLDEEAEYTDPQNAEVLASPSCAALIAREGGFAGAAAEGAGYTGVQDYGDYPVDPGHADPLFYDPDDVRGAWAAAGWPTYPGLMDRAQKIAIQPDGLDVPFYITNGNHDALVQGNEDANQAFERIALGCTKVLGSTLVPNQDPAPETLLDFLRAADQTMPVPPDPDRRFVSKTEIKQIYSATSTTDDDHGFAFVDEDENEASEGSASYYAWNPKQTPGFRFISIDTVSEGGVLGPFGPQPTGSSDGNIDDPQFEWLRQELDEAQVRGKLIVVFGHHPLRSMSAAIPDEAAPSCTAPDDHGHDVNPGCDLDPRNSNPVHLGTPAAAEELGSEARTVQELFADYPNLVAYVPGHTHENEIRTYPRKGGAYWEVNTSAVVDHPQQSRLVEVFDNDDGTLSIFATILDHGAPATAPAGCAEADPADCPSDFSASFDEEQLASIGRTFAWNDPQLGHAHEVAEGSDGDAETHPSMGSPLDRNVELLVGDPRIRRSGGGQGKPPRCAGKDATIVGTTLDDKLRGTKGRDVIVSGPGKDKVKGRGGRDIVCAGAGKDRVDGGGGKDKLKGTTGKDRLKGKGGRDRLGGHRGRDRLNGGSGKDRLSGGRGRDRLDGGPGKDRCNSNQGKDRTSKRSCERIAGEKSGERR